MKVRCTKLLDALGNSQTRSAWLTVGKVYHVLSIVLDSHGRWLLRLMGDSQPGVGLFPFAQFEITSSRVPSCWIATWNDDGVFELTTEAWNQLGFWERYFEHDVIAKRTFENEMRKIIDADP